jgi:hypothetical protein
VELRGRRSRAVADARAIGVRVADLQRWGYAWQGSDAGWIAERIHDADRCYGFGMKYPKTFAALFSASGTVWLQLGRRTWDVADISAVVQTYERLRKAHYDIVLRDGSSIQITIRFPAAVVALRLIDPTYDEIASLSDDIMKILPYTSPEDHEPTEDIATWLSRVGPLWDQGIRHSGAP